MAGTYSQIYIQIVFAVRGRKGYDALSYSHSHIERVYNYILNQEEHHKHTTFKAEYYDLLEKFNIDYHDKYLFEWLD